MTAAVNMISGACVIGFEYWIESVTGKNKLKAFILKPSDTKYAILVKYWLQNTPVTI